MGRQKTKDLERTKYVQFVPTPADLTAKERRFYEGIVFSYAPDHFTLGEVELLKNYAKNFVLLEEYNKQLRLLPLLSKEHRNMLGLIKIVTGLQGDLSQRLRVSPSARMTRTGDSVVLSEHKTTGDEFDGLL